MFSCSSMAVGGTCFKGAFGLPIALPSEANACAEKLDTDAPKDDQVNSADYRAYLEKRYPLPALNKIVDFEPTCELIDYHRFPIHHNWRDHPFGKLRVERALQLMGRVWSSREFKERLENAPLLTWRYDATKPEAADRNIRGADLYAKLLSNKKPVLQLRLVTDGSSVGTSEAAHSSGFSDVISLQYEYASTNATVYQLTNTISHEYTHLAATGASYDGARTGDSLSLYVSYGIGGLTENMAAGTRLYCSEIPNATA